jgi:16S rRNA (uracil1498-N3)-methyltransferase
LSFHATEQGSKKKKNDKKILMFSFLFCLPQKNKKEYMRRFFVEPENIVGPTAVLTGAEARHITAVLRLAPGTTITLFDGSGSYFEALITKVSPSRIETKIISITPYIDAAEDFPPALHLGVGLLKGKKMDFIIQKITELGISSLHPFRSQYCASYDLAASRLSRWQKIVLEACKQCNRPKPPDINPTKDFKDLLSGSGEDGYDLKLIFWENKEDQKPVREIFTSLKEIHSVMILVGPEGGFSTDEVGQAIAAGYEPVTMGSRILRAETAVIAAVSILQHELGNLA